MEEQRTAFACPHCQGELDRRSEELFCTTCRESYPLIAGGIAALFPRDRPPEYVSDPGMPFREALALAERLAAEPGSFRDLVGLYYESFRAGRDPGLFEHCRNIVANRGVTDVSDEVVGVCRGLDMMQAVFPQVRLAAEVGCGWGFSLASLAQGYKDHPFFRARPVLRPGLESRDPGDCPAALSRPRAGQHRTGRRRCGVVVAVPPRVGGLPFCRFRGRALARTASEHPAMGANPLARFHPVFHRSQPLYAAPGAAFQSPGRRLCAAALAEALRGLADGRAGQARRQPGPTRPQTLRGRSVRRSPPICWPPCR